MNYVYRRWKGSSWKKRAEECKCFCCIFQFSLSSLFFQSYCGWAGPP